jgi:hypothetical protein
MKIQYAMIVWRNDNVDFLRVIDYGTVDLGLFDSRFSIDCAIHPKYQALSDKEAKEYLTKLLVNLLNKGFSTDTIYFNLIGVEGLEYALNLAMKQLKPIINLSQLNKK